MLHAHGLMICIHVTCHYNTHCFFLYKEHGFRLGIDIGFVDTSRRKRKPVKIQGVLLFVCKRDGKSQSH